MRGLIDHGIASHHLTQEPSTTHNGSYKLYFGLGQGLTLTHTSDVFRVSHAGVRLGHYLVKRLDSNASNRSFLDMGTGSGVHALLMRKLGNNNIIATDISERSIKQAKINERINFKNNKISFFASDLFKCIPERKFNIIVFNPPGWQTPSRAFIQQLEIADREGQLPTSALFYGDAVITRFLDDPPKYLEPTGVAIIGLNSLVGIREVLNSYNKKHNDTPPLSYRFIERHTFPLIHYSAQWQMLSSDLQKEFKNWEKQDRAAFSTDNIGTIYWSYEVIEFFHHPASQS